jgi:predicted MFS family arabinose efflux permease
VALTLLTGLAYQTGHFISYTYFTVVFDRALHHNTLLVGALLVLWGASGMVANLIAGRLSDTIGNRKVIFGGLVALALVMALLPLASANILSAAIAVAVWGGVAWGLLAPQQHRLVAVAAHSAPVVLGLNTSGTYLGVTAAGVIGAVGVQAIGAHSLGYLSAAFVVIAIVLAEWATLRINAANRKHPTAQMASV